MKKLRMIINFFNGSCLVGTKNKLSEERMSKKQKQTRRDFIRLFGNGLGVIYVAPETLVKVFDKTPELANQEIDLVLEKDFLILDAKGSFDEAATRKRIPIKEYLDTHDRLMNSGKAQEFTKFIANHTPFQEGSSVTTTFNTNHGPIAMSLTCDSFLPKRTPKGIINFPSGATISEIHKGLGKYNRTDPASMKDTANAAARDINLVNGKPGHVTQLIIHLEKSHGLQVVVNKRYAPALKVASAAASAHYIS